jgi:hypothetical protein
VRPPDYGPQSDWLNEHCPFLASYLYSGSWNGKDPREASTIFLVANAGMVTVTLKCPTEGYQTSGVGDGLVEALTDLDRKCADPCHQWKELKRGTGAQKLRDTRKNLPANSDSEDYDNS